MRWNRGHHSDDVEDRRHLGGKAKMGIGGSVVVLIVALLFGADISSLVGGGGGGSTSSSSQSEPIDPNNDPEAELKSFVSFVFDDAQAAWARLFSQSGRTYRKTRMILYRRGTRSGCGYGSSAIGPFYCPADEKVYIDLSFFKTLKQRLGAPGDFAQAYVIAHEVGHHVQNVLGTEAKVRRQRRGLSKAASNALSVRVELQADCYAGVWAHSTKKRDLLERGDVQEAIGAAAAIGDDTLQRGAGKRVSPESWTHGSSAERTRWFKRGMEAGSLAACNTFGRQ